MIYCFTGTGNSLWAAKELGRILKTPVEGLIKYRNMPLECPDCKRDSRESESQGGQLCVPCNDFQ